jgi:diaminohydroxyphosphoribosylaminopyrimidine deaminase / 5-amino-6-(5-phosphoribosylamino)uracil reductase
MDDLDHMRHALALGRRTMGATGKNPAVGCVLVKESCVVGVGWTEEGGVPHAETRALAMAGDRAAGATAYVSLEPCSHRGRTSPCANALVDAGVTRVVTAIEDPDPRVRGKGHGMLREAGLKVENGILEKEARRDLAGFFSRLMRGRPYVILKLALSSDGMIAAAPGRRTAITGEEANLRTHLMRAQSDAIMVGVGTVKTDDPSLTCRLPGLEHRSPIAVIVDGGLSTPGASKLVTNARHRPLIILTAAVSKARDEIANRGIELIRCRETAAGRIDLAHGLEQLGKRGINRLLVEGGANVAGQLIEGGLVDEMTLFKSATSLGNQGVPANLDLDGFEQTNEEELGQDLLIHYEKR